MIINKNLNTIPFDKLYHTYEEAANATVEGLEQHNQAIYDAEIARLEQEYSDTHEAPSEVGFGDLVEKPHIDVAEVRRRAGQKAIVDIWIPRYKLNSLLFAVMPQIMAWIASKPFRFSEISTVEGKIDGSKILKYIFDFNKEWDRGLYLFLMMDSRSAYLPTQYKGEGTQFCALVPLILYAYKLHHKVPYSKWDRETLKWVVNSSLHKAMLFDKEFTRDEIMHARELGLVYQSGVKKGESRNPQSSFKLWSTKGGCMSGVPELAQVMFTQIWCAHPSNRTPYMVLDPHNWDIMPTPLISENIFVQAHKSTASSAMDLPWEIA